MSLMGQEVRSHREEMTPTGFVKNGMNRAQSLRFPSLIEGPVAQTKQNKTKTNNEVLILFICFTARGKWGPVNGAVKDLEKFWF